MTASHSQLRETAAPLAVSPETAAAMLGVSRAKLYEKLAHKELPSYKDGASRRIPVAALYAYVDGKLAEGR